MDKVRLFYLDRSDDEYGPFTGERIREFLAEGRALPTDLSWVLGEAEWVPLDTRPEFVAGSTPVNRPSAKKAGGGPRSPHWCWLGLIPLTSGLPHIILGQRAKGIVVTAALIGLSVVSSLSLDQLSVVLGMRFLCALSMLDAFAVGCFAAEHGAVPRWACLPSSKRCDFKRRGAHFALLVAFSSLCGFTLLLLAMGIATGPSLNTRFIESLNGDEITLGGERVLSTEQIAQAYAGTVFQVRTTWKQRGGFLWLDWKETGVDGSAVLVANSREIGLLVSNRHVVLPASADHRDLRVCVRLQEMDEWAKADPVAFAQDPLDLVFLRVSLTGSWKPKIVPCKRLAELRLGESCVAIGNALGAGTAVTVGVLSRADTKQNISYIRTSAPISPGNSGGGLVLSRGGHLVGIVTATMKEGQNVNLVIPMDYALDERTWSFLPGEEASKSLFQEFQNTNR